MAESSLVGLASIVVVGVFAYWLAWRIRLPAILLLLVFGFIAGPVTGFLDSDRLLGDLLSPIVSLSVAVILFEGGLSLKLGELRDIGVVVRRLITRGIVVTWLITGVTAHWVLGLEWPIATLLGGLLVVTGPTVIVPLLRQIRPTGQAGPILKWEGMFNDALGAILAVLVFEAIISGDLGAAPTTLVVGMLQSLAVSALLGGAGALVLVLLLKRFWVPDFLDSPMALMLVVLVFTASNAVRPESGLLSVILMGVVLANQSFVAVKHIIEFKENLRVLLISALFIILAARIRSADLELLTFESGVFVAILVLVTRPLAVLASTIGTKLDWRQTLFVAWMAPRGVVAAAVASVFGLRLVEAGYPSAEQLVPVTFLVIAVTVSLYGLTAGPLARWLGVADANPQGTLIVGAHPWAVEIARTLQAENIPVMLVDSNWANVGAARMQGLRVHYGDVLSAEIIDQIDLAGLGRLLALTPNDEANTLATLQFAHVFGRSEVYQLAPRRSGSSGAHLEIPNHLRGHILFGRALTYDRLSQLFEQGATLRTTRLTPKFDLEALRSGQDGEAVLLFTINSNRQLKVFTDASAATVDSGKVLISLATPAAKIAPGASATAGVDGNTATSSVAAAPR